MHQLMAETLDAIISDIQRIKDDARRRWRQRTARGGP